MFVSFYSWNYPYIDTSSNSEMIQAGRIAESTTSDTSTSVGKNK